MSNILEVDFKTLRQPVTQKIDSKPAHIYCRCNRVGYDVHSREIICRDCGQVIDAFDYVVKMGDKENRLFNNIRQYEGQQQELQESIHKLKIEEKNVKARLKNAKAQMALLEKSVEKKLSEQQTQLSNVSSKEECLKIIRDKVR